MPQIGLRRVRRPDGVLDDRPAEAAAVADRVADRPSETLPLIRILFRHHRGARASLAALGTVLARNLVHAALFLVAFFFLVACQFVLLEAEFLAAMQVLVYIGAVAILLMFGIMLTRNIQGDETTGGRWTRKIPAALVAARRAGRPGRRDPRHEAAGRPARPGRDRGPGRAARPARPTARVDRAAARSTTWPARRRRDDDPLRRPVRGRRPAADRRPRRRHRPDRDATTDDRSDLGDRRRPTAHDRRRPGRRRPRPPDGHGRPRDARRRLTPTREPDPMNDDIPLTWFLYFAAAAFAIGLFGVLVRRNAIAVLMAIEIMLNAANINLLAFWRYGDAAGRRGPADRRDDGPLRDHDRRGRGRRRHRPDPALLPPLEGGRRRPLRQPRRLNDARNPDRRTPAEPLPMARIMPVTLNARTSGISPPRSS